MSCSGLTGLNRDHKHRQASSAFSAVPPTPEQTDELLKESLGRTADGYSIGWLALQVRAVYASDYV